MSAQSNNITNALEKPPSEPVPEGAAPENPKDLKEGESAGKAEQATIDDPKSPDDLETYFNRVATEKGEAVAAQKVLEQAIKMAEVKGDRAMHLLQNSGETINGALSRIGYELSAGADARASFKQIQEQMDLLRAEARERLNALAVEAANNNDAFAKEDQAKAA
ncbi:MAG: hypothetical protein WCO25_02515 [Candidatus Uhrbacteria bacterium]